MCGYLYTIFPPHSLLASLAYSSAIFQLLVRFSFSFFLVICSSLLRVSARDLVLLIFLWVSDRKLEWFFSIIFIFQQLLSIFFFVFCYVWIFGLIFVYPFAKNCSSNFMGEGNEPTKKQFLYCSRTVTKILRFKMLSSVFLLFLFFHSFFSHLT